MSKLLPIAGVVLAALAWWLARGEPTLAPTALAPVAPTDATAVRSSVEPEPGQAPSDLDVDREAVPLAGPLAEPMSAAPQPSPTELWGRVIDADRGEPAAFVEVELQHHRADQCGPCQTLSMAERVSSASEINRAHFRGFA